MDLVTIVEDVRYGYDRAWEPFLGSSNYTGRCSLMAVVKMLAVTLVGPKDEMEYVASQMVLMGGFQTCHSTCCWRTGACAPGSGLSPKILMTSY
jgi:hypothetical protein